MEEQRCMLRGRVCPGSMTVLFCLLSVILLALLGASFYSVGYASFRLLTAESMELGLYSLMGQYDREVLEQYDMFVLDGTFGTGSLRPDRMIQEVEDYANIMLHAASPGGNMSQSGLLAFTLATDEGGNAWKRQAVVYMKESLGSQGVSMLLNQLEKQKGTAEEQAEKEELEKEEDPQREYDRQLQKKEEQEEAPETVIEVDENPIEVIRDIKKMGILGLVLPPGGQVSEKKVRIGELLSHRNRERGMGEGEEETFSPLEELLYQEYCMQRLSYYGEYRREGLLDYQMEYVLAGKESDAENLKAVIHRLLLLREASNYVYLYTNEAVRQETAVFALALAGGLGIPQAAPVVEALLRLCWAYGESLLDIRILLSGGSVPLVKNQDSWRLSLENLSQVLSLLEQPDLEEKGDSAMNYRAYLRLLLFMTADKRKQTMRSLDMIEGNIRCVPGKQQFRLDCCVQSVEMEGWVRDTSQRTYCVKRCYQYNG